MPNLAPFLSYVFVTTFTPGPNNIMSMSYSNHYGFRATHRFILGVFAGFFVIILMSSYLNLFLFNLIPRIKIFMEILGTVYMLYLAFKIITSKPGSNKDNPENGNSFVSGFMLQFLNPKLILYCLTVISNFVIPYYRSSASLLLFSALLAFVGLLATTSWAFFGILFQKLLADYQIQFNLVMGLLLVYSAVSVFI